MGRFSYEKNIPKIGGRGGNKGKRATPKNQFRNQCGNCGGTLPCNDSGCRKASGQDSYNARNAPAKSKTKKAKLTWGQKSKIRKDVKNSLRRKNPTVSDSDIKKAQRAAIKRAKP